MAKNFLLLFRRVLRHLAPALGQTHGLLLAFFLTCSLASIAAAHPIHTSYAEADFRPATNKLEVALRVYPDDLEAALTARVGTPVSVSKTPAVEFDALLLAYLRATFLVRAADGTTLTLHLLGRALKDRDQHLWIYLECALPDGLTGVRLSHRVLRDTFPGQLNALRLRTTAGARTILFLDGVEKTLAPP